MYRCIHIVRYSSLSRTTESNRLCRVLCRPLQAINAAPYGVVGVLVYTDPLDINDGLMSDENETYPHSWYLPPSGVERGGYATNFGDMLTPYLAAKGEEALAVALRPRRHQKQGVCSRLTRKDKNESWTMFLPQRKPTGFLKRTSQGSHQSRLSPSDLKTHKHWSGVWCKSCAVK